jgi:lipid A 3-O-deacylase
MKLRTTAYMTSSFSLAVLRIMICIIAMSCKIASAQDPPMSLASSAEKGSAVNGATWNFGGWFAGGFPPDYEIHPGDAHAHQTLELFNAGFEAGRILTDDHGSGILRGRGEAILEIIPFWLAYSPQQKITIYDPRNTYPTVAEITSYSSHGVSLTPLLFRWNFTRGSVHQFLPWVQLGSGLLWTADEFPQPTGGKGSNTSRINFTPQAGLGENIFTKRDQSVDLAVKFVHISSAGLGENNPGIPISLQFSVGYSWWK